MPAWTFSRIGALSMIIGVIAFVVFVALIPADPSAVFDDPQETLDDLVDNENLWLAANTLGLVGISLVVVGLGALSRSFTTEPVRLWGRKAFIAVLVGFTLFLVVMAADSFGIRGVAESWADAPVGEKATALRIFEAIEAVNMGLWGLAVASLLGVTIVLYGIAIATGDMYPRWLGWVAIALGLESIVLGMAIAFAGASAKSTDDFEFLFIPHAVLAVWVLVMGVLLWLKGGQSNSR